MIIKNGVVFTDECRFAALDILVKGDRIVRLAPAGSLTDDEPVVDAGGRYVLPGFVDVHTHGAVGEDFSDGTVEGLKKLLPFYASQGVTTVIGTTMSLPGSVLENVVETYRPFVNQDGMGAVLRGINLEGPFINLEKKGAQNGEYIINPSLEMFETLWEKSGGTVRLIDLAPEGEGSMAFIQEASWKCAVSIAHTNANYDTACAAFHAGASHVTHLFNAMPPFHHRDPGVIGAASDYAAAVEIISDGHHLHPAVVRSVFRWFGADRICIVSDSMRGCGMPDGEYDLGGQMVRIENDTAHLADGTIAGSVASVGDCVERAVSFGISMEKVVEAASATPARSVRLYDEVGSLTPGKRADILLAGPALRAETVIIGGEIFSA